MRITIQKSTNLGEILQVYCMAILEGVVNKMGKDLIPEPNGDASAKVGFPDKYGFSYLYLGFDSHGFLVGQFMKELATGRPVVIYGPVTLAKTVTLPISVIANQIVGSLPKGL